MIERILAGDAAAFEPLVTPYRQSILALAGRIVRNPEDAKEVAQETLLRAFRYLHSCDRDLGFRNWLFQIAVNSARSFMKSRAGRDDMHRTMARTLADAGPDDGPDARHERTDLRARILDCLDVLSRREREVFLLREIEDLSVEEAAAVLRCSSISVRVHLNAARRKVRNRFLERYPDERRPS